MIPDWLFVLAILPVGVLGRFVGRWIASKIERGES